MLHQLTPELPFEGRLPAPERAEPTLAILDALGAAPFGIAVFDRELRFVHVNAAMAEANGQPAAAHVGRTMRELLRAPRGGRAYRRGGGARPRRARDGATGRVLGDLLRARRGGP